MENYSGQAIDYRDVSINAFTLYVGALSCMRHRGEEFFRLQQEGRLAFLILNEIDYITGEYMDKIREAAETVVREQKPEMLNIAAGCQSALLSSDYDSLQEELEAGLGIRVRVDRNCHLNGYDHHRSGRTHGGERGGRDGGTHGRDHDGRTHGGEHGGRGGRIHGGEYGGRDGRNRGRGHRASGSEHGGRHGREGRSTQDRRGDRR